MVSAGVPENYEIFVDKQDGYSYYYPSDWRVCRVVRVDSFKKKITLLLLGNTCLSRTGI